MFAVQCANLPIGLGRQIAPASQTRIAHTDLVRPVHSSSGGPMPTEWGGLPTEEIATAPQQHAQRIVRIQTEIKRTNVHESHHRRRIESEDANAGDNARRSARLLFPTYPFLHRSHGTTRW